jgi:hypothetical protein
MRLLPTLLVTALFGAPALPVVHAAVTPLEAQTAADPSLSIRATLTQVPAAGALRQAAERHKLEDPSATFTWLRGHVDAFSARPKPTVPDYALPILAAHGLSTAPSLPLLETTTDQPHALGGTPMPPAERKSNANVGFDGADDSAPRPDTDAPPDKGRALAPATEARGYPQQGRDAVKEILTAFLRRHNDVFELDEALLAQRLPNLALTKYGVGRHFRRAEFTQTVGGVPLLDGKTLVLFDLNWNVIAISPERQRERAVTGT